ncbi:MAG: hypothetical protein ABJA94_07885 [Rhodoglobus sp.]
MDETKTPFTDPDADGDPTDIGADLVEKSDRSNDRSITSMDGEYRGPVHAKPSTAKGWLGTPNLEGDIMSDKPSTDDKK